jgi:Tol biopolymer transport system component
MLLFGQQNIEENSQNIFAVDARMDGTPLQLTEGMPGNIACPRLSPDKSTLVFFVSGAQSDLFLLNIQDGSLAKLTDDGTESVEASCADWSPDGSQLTYSATIKSENEQTIRQIFIINADGSKKQMLTANNDKKDGFRNPVWSPDSSMIAFNSDTNGIYTMNADGSNLKPFGNYGLRYGDFHWSPDGSQVVFACYASSAKTNICIANSDGKGFRKIETPSLTSIYETAWSPDGEWIAFIAKKKEVGNIFIIKPDGSNLTQVTRLEGVTPLWLSWVSDFNLPATYVQVP